RANAFARDWSDAQARLAETGGLAPALEREHAASVTRLEQLEAQLAAAEQAWEHQTGEAQKTSAAVIALQAHISRNELELEAEGLLTASLTEQQQHHSELNQECERLDVECANLRADAQNKAAEAARLDERRN